MEGNNTIFLEIEAYLSGEMTQEEQTAFEGKIDKDTELAQEVELQRLTHSVLTVNNQASYKEMLQAYDAELEETDAEFIRPFWQQTWLRAVAGVAFLLVAAYTIVYLQFNSHTIGGSAFAPYENVLSVRSSDPLNDGLLQQGMDAYSKQNYQEAISQFEQLPNQEEFHLAQLYQGISYLAIQDPEQALTSLKPLIEQSSTVQETAEWYTIIALIQLDKPAQAQSLLSTVAENPEHAYHEQAKKLEKEYNHPIRSLLGIP